MKARKIAKGLKIGISLFVGSLAVFLFTKDGEQPKGLKTASGGAPSAQSPPTPIPNQTPAVIPSAGAYGSGEFLDRLRKIAARDLTAALQIIDTEVPLVERTAIRFALLKSLCLDDPKYVGNLGAALNSQQCSRLLKELAKDWVREDNNWSVLVTTISGIPNEKLRTQALTTLGEASADKKLFDFAEACLGNLSDHSARRYIVINLASAEAINDSERAIKFVASLRDKGEAIRAYEAIADIFAARKESSLLTRLLQNADADARPFIWQAVGKIEGAKGDISVLGTHTNLSKSDERALFLGYIESVPQRQLQDATTRVFSTEDEDLARRASYICINRILSGGDFVGASKWAMECPDKVREEMLQQLLQTWGVKDEQSAIRWVESLPSGADRDIALKIASHTVRQSDKQTASRLAKMIENPNARRLALKYLDD